MGNKIFGGVVEGVGISVERIEEPRASNFL